MKKTKLVISLFAYFVLVVPIFSQGFDWRESAREPFASPRLFIGAFGGGGYSSHFGEISFYESQINCSEFESGSGYNAEFGAKSEFWISPKSALVFQISYSKLFGAFSKENEPLPIKDSDPLITENQLDITTNYINFTLGAKYRVYEYFFAEPSLILSILSSSNFSLKEEVLSPDYYHFHTIPESKIRDISNGKISDLNATNLALKIAFGFDYNAGLYKYISPKLSVAMPLNSYLKTSSYRNLSVNLSIDLNIGILENIVGVN